MPRIPRRAAPAPAPLLPALRPLRVRPVPHRRYARGRLVLPAEREHFVCVPHRRRALQLVHHRRPHRRRPARVKLAAARLISQPSRLISGHLAILQASRAAARIEHLRLYARQVERERGARQEVSDLHHRRHKRRRGGRRVSSCAHPRNRENTCTQAQALQRPRREENTAEHSGCVSSSSRRVLARIWVGGR